MLDSTYRGNWAAWGVTAALLLSGCLSPESVDVRDEDDVPMDGEDPGDGDAAPGACFDRGSYELDGITIRGSERACDGGRVCIDSRRSRCSPMARNGSRFPANSRCTA